MAFSMDGINGMLSQATSQASNLSATNLQNSINSVSKDAEEEKLKDACRQFEAYFIEQVYKEMMNTIPKSKDEDGSLGMLTDYFKDNFIQEVANQTSEQQGLGLAQQLYEQMRRNLGLDSVPVKTEETVSSDDEDMDRLKGSSAAEES